MAKKSLVCEDFYMYFPPTNSPFAFLNGWRPTAGNCIKGVSAGFCIFAMGASIRNHPESAVRNGSGRVINQTITVCFFFPQRRRVSEESYILITYWDYKKNPTFYHCKQNLVESICSKVSPGTINEITGTDSFKNVQIHHFRFGSIKPP